MTYLFFPSMRTIFKRGLRGEKPKRAPKRIGLSREQPGFKKKAMGMTAVKHR